MAVLSDSDRAAVNADLNRAISQLKQDVTITKSDLRAAVNALDDFLNTNAAAINNALPTAAKNGLTVQQKALLLMAVVARRYEVT